MDHPLTVESALIRMNDRLGALPDYPGGFEGRGVVIPGGGPKYFPCAWVCIRMLRYLGCELPIELWHLGAKEISDSLRRLVEPYGVRCVDAHEVRRQFPARKLDGWELKPYAIIHSRFREVLFLDADNVCAQEPTRLFQSIEYLEKGAVFWPDPYCLGEEDPIWNLTGIKFRREPAFESGQIVVDKERCWKSLGLTMWMNEYSDFWYQFIYGDKDTFHLAWHKCGQPYAMPMIPFESLGGVICQFDFEGQWLFQHRHGRKWKIDAENPKIRRFMYEETCLGFLDELRAHASDWKWA